MFNISFSFQLQDLEMENSKLKNDINRLREALAKEDPSNKAQDLLGMFGFSFSKILFILIIYDQLKSSNMSSLSGKSFLVDSLINHITK